MHHLFFCTEFFLDIQPLKSAQQKTKCTIITTIITTGGVAYCCKWN